MTSGVPIGQRLARLFAKILAKSHIRATTRHYASGKVGPVVQHEDKRSKHEKPKKKGRAQAAPWQLGPGLARDEEGVWRYPDGKAAPDKIQKRIAAVATPPAWTNVHLNPDPKAPLQVKGLDAAGRAQPRYLKGYRKRNKWTPNIELDKVGHALEKRFASDALNQRLDPKTRQCGAVLYLMATIGIRVGTSRDLKGEADAFGATTLLHKHVSVRPPTSRLMFQAKRGKKVEYLSEDPMLARILRTFHAKGAKPKDRIFAVEDSHVRAYLKEKGGTNKDGSAKFIPHDFRTRYATGKAHELVSSMPVPTNATQLKKAKNVVAQHVGELLWDTPTVALNTYINPVVFKRWEKAVTK